jgi:uncharacterized protein (TIGR02246 family)
MPGKTTAKADDAKTIAQRLDDSWIAAYNKDDAAGVAALYASDAALLPQGTAQPIIGASKIREFLDGFMKQKVSNLVLPVTEARWREQLKMVASTALCRPWSRVTTHASWEEAMTKLQSALPPRPLRGVAGPVDQ